MWEKSFKNELNSLYKEAGKEKIISKATQIMKNLKGKASGVKDNFKGVKDNFKGVKDNFKGVKDDFKGKASGVKDKAIAAWKNKLTSAKSWEKWEKELGDRGLAYAAMGLAGFLSGKKSTKK